jgi:hypothetical protein
MNCDLSPLRFAGDANVISKKEDNLARIIAPNSGLAQQVSLSFHLK